MNRSFYHYIQTHRGLTKPTEISELAESIFFDNQFPKQSVSYHEISDYLETNAYYVPSMDIFDELWQYYVESNA